MKVLSDFYTYSKNKSSAVLNLAGSGEADKKQVEASKKQAAEGSWFSNAWSATTSWSPRNWFANISVPKYSFPKLSFPNYSLPKFSLPKCSLPTSWFKTLCVKFEETKNSSYLYLVELHTTIKDKSFTCLRFSCLRFNSNPKYAAYPWYKRVFFIIRDNIYAYVYIADEKASAGQHDEGIEMVSEKKSSKSKLDEERPSADYAGEEKFGIKHSQSSKYSNDLTTYRNSKKLKKTNTDDMNNVEEESIATKNVASASMFSKDEQESKVTSDLIDKTDSIYVDAQEEKFCDAEESKEVKPADEEQKPEVEKKPSGESSKFNIKKTWDRFSKIIS